MAENSDTQSTSDSKKSIPSDDDLKFPQIPKIPYFPTFQHGDVNMLPIMYPALLPGLGTTQNSEQPNRGPGIYAVPMLPFMGTLSGIPANTFIPLTYNTPTRSISSEATSASGEQSQSQMGAQQQQQQQALQHGPQRQIVGRRFPFPFQLDFPLLLKLAAMIFIFSQDGSRHRLAVLVFFASIIYLYQTGALTPLVRWISQAMHRAAAPPRPPRPAAMVEPIVRQGDDNGAAAAAEAQPGAENESPRADGAEHLVENEAAPEAGVEGGNHWWGIVKEIQMIVFGFITSLLPGFHNMDHA
ncbi:uncharacterized protein LOC130814439 isoform X2 [Amaranthus tricolor]|uniref:uncharacterized protein LOC130814439 isoform X2 n=1 Tax=Amaranthus tricolor TaxID=29722 RepID=UPI0025844446|nr:uncharacterized protein LOC130814439 isoform X2 [Amaranthus tricolor]